MRLEGKTCIVTGGASGIGRAVAIAFALEGAKVVVSDVSEYEGDSTAKLISRTGGDAIFVRCDVSNESDVKNLVDAASKNFGLVNVLFNNAGVNLLEGNVVEIPLEDWRRVFGTNIDGVFYCCRYVIPLMRTAGGGSIINTASPGSFKGWRNNAAYLASKGAVLSLTKALAIDHASDNIRVNAIVPGLIMTGIGERFLAAQANADEVRKGIPLGRFGEPGDVAPIVVHLASDEAAFSTGAAFMVDGGELAR